MKKSLLLLLMSVCSSLCAHAADGDIFTAQTVEGWNMVFTVLDESAKTCQVGYIDGSWDKTAVDNETVEGSVTIPATVEGYTVVKIGKYALYSAHKMTSVSIPNTVTTLDESAFNNCYNLTSITIPENVSFIGDFVFDCSRLIFVTVEAENPITVSEWAFPNRGDAILRVPSGCKAAYAADPNWAFGTIMEGNEGSIFNAMTTEGINMVFTILDETAKTCQVGYLDGAWDKLAVDRETVEGPVTIPQIVEGYTVAKIGKHAFNNVSGMTSVTIPNTVTAIDEYAFNDCYGLTSFELPAAVVSLGDYALIGINNLTSFNVAEGNTIYDSRGNCNAIIETATNKLLFGCRNTIIPASVTEIGSNAFYNVLHGCTIIIPSTIKKIDDHAFSNTNMTLQVEHTTPLQINDEQYNGFESSTLRVPTGCKAYYASATGWKNFGTILEGNEGTVIKSTTAEGWEMAFTILDETAKTCQVGYIDGSWDKTAVDRESVEGSVTIPEVVEGYAVVKIGRSAFENVHRMASVTIPSTVTAIDENAFTMCNGLTSFELPAAVVSLGDYALAGLSNVTSFTVAEGNPNYDSRGDCNAIIEKATNKLLFGCKNTIIPTSVLEIGNGSFSEIYDYTLTIPSSITTIDESAFIGSNLTLQVEHTTPLGIDESVFMNVHNSILRVPAGCKADYAAATGWSLFSNILEGNEGTVIASTTVEGWEMAFTILDETDKTCQVGYLDGSWDKTAVDKETVEGSVTIPEEVEGYTVVKIGKNAFDNVYKMTSVTIPNTVTAFDDFAFDNCHGLTSFELPAAVISLGNYALAGLNNVTSFKVTEGNPNFDSRGDCNAIIEKATNKLLFGCRNTIIPASVTEIGSTAFSMDDNTLTIPSTITTIDEYAFSGNNLTLQVEYTTPLDIDESVFMNVHNSTLRVPSGSKAAYAAATGWSRFDNILQGNEGSTITAQTVEGWEMTFTVLDETAKTCQVGYIDGSWDKTAVDRETVEGSVTIPETVNDYTVVKIGRSAFDDINRMASVTIPNSVTTIDESAFNSCTGLTSLEIPSSVTTIEAHAFAGLGNANSITVAEGNPNYDSRDNCNAIIEKATYKLLFGCRTTIIPTSVSEIGETSFVNIHGYTLTIPSTITAISDNAINGGNVTLQVDRTTPLEIDENAIYVWNSILRVPSGSKAAYAAATGWSRFDNILQGNEGSTITAQTVEGLDMVFTVLDETAKTCQVGYLDGSWDKTAVDKEEVEGPVTIPETVEGYTVVRIGQNAFDNVYRMTSVTIPSTVTAFDDFAFVNCHGLTSFELPAAVISLGDGALTGLNNVTSFKVTEGNPNFDSRGDCNAIIETATDKLLFGCRNTIIPASVTEIGSSAFDMHNYTLTIPSTITTIDEYAFSGDNLILQVEHTTPLVIEENVFMNVHNSTLRVPSGSKAAYAAATGWSRFDNILQGNEGSVFTAQTVDGWDMVFTILDETAKTCQVGYLNGSWDRLAVDKETVDGPVTIPEIVEGYTVVKIGRSAFNNVYNMTSVTIPNTVTSIENEAFSSVNDCTIHLPSAISMIGDYAFNWCNNLTLEVEHTTPLVINENVFEGINNSTLRVPVGCRDAYTTATGWMNFNEIQEWASPSDMFVFTANPDGTTCSVTGYKDYCVGDVAIPESWEGLTVTSIGNNAFYSCVDLTSISIPSSVTSIGDGAFGNCSGLTSITIPLNVTSIGVQAFSYCSNLTSIKVENGNTKYDSRDNCNAIIETATNTLIRGTKKTKIPNDVTSIGVDAFNGTGLTSMTIPNSVTYIANQAFLGCSSLTSLTISENVTYIGFSTFAGCSGLTSLTIPKNVTTIGDYAFSGCTEVTSVTVKSTTPVAISEGTFANKANATLYVPEGSKAAYQAADEWKEFMEIVEVPVEATWTDSNGMTWSFTVSGTEARNIKPAMSKIYVYGENPAEQPPFTTSEWQAEDMRFSSYEGSRYLPTLSDEVYWGLKTLIFDVSDVSSNFNLRVMNGWWSNTYYDNVKWEDGLNELQITPTIAAECSSSSSGGEGKDLNLMLTAGKVTINAVYYESVSIHNPVVVIPAKVYDGSTELTVTSIAEGAFDGCSNMTSITIPSSVTSIGSGAFYGCSGLTSIVVEDGNAIYDSRDNCNAIIETGTNTLIAGCNNTVIPSSVTFIGEGAFKSRLYLTSMTIPNSVTSIGNNAFEDCNSIAFMTIPSSVTSIGENAFSGCSHLTSVSVKKGTPLPINENTFTNRTNATLYVPQGSKDNYLAADYWQEFNEIVEINTTPSDIINFADANVKAICVTSWDFDDDGELSESEAASITDPYLGGVFVGKANITSFDELRYFTGLTSIATGTFSGCYGLTSVAIPNNVTSIGDWAFSSCNLTSMTIPKIVTSIGTGVFSNCNALTSLSVESGNAKYDSRGGCNAIIETETNTLISGTKNTVIPNSVNSIGGWAFYSIVDMTSVTIPNSVTSIGEGAFCYCLALTSITIPNSVTTIGNNAFASCDGLTSVTIPSSVTFIGAWAFSGCGNLTSVTVKSKTPITTSEEFAYSFPFSNRANATLYVPEGSKADYQAATYWNEFKEIVEIGMDLPANEIFSGTNLWAGYVAQEDLIPGTGLKVYVITKLGTTTATASQIDYMPQGVPVLLKRADTTVSSYEVTSGTGTAPATNLLRVFNADRNVSNREGFILFNDEFVLVNEGVLPAGRVFLPANNLQMSRGMTRSIVIDDDDATGIEGNWSAADDADEQWFDLQGRRLEQKPTKKGIYILNGRKVVVK